MTSTTVGALTLKSVPSFSPDAKKILAEHGPEVFRTIFGSHFIWKVMISAESGVCISISTQSHMERESLSVVVDINLLFWSITLEAELLNRVEAHLQQNLDVAIFDTMSGHFSHPSGTQLDLATLTKIGTTARENIGQLENRLEARVKLALDSEDGLEASKNLNACVTTVLIAPWSILADWHEGLRSWRLQH